MTPLDFLGAHLVEFLASAGGTVVIWRLVVWMPNETPIIPRLKRKKKVDPIADMCEWKRKRREEDLYHWLDDWIRIEAERKDGKKLDRYDVDWQINRVNENVAAKAKKKAKKAGSAQQPYVTVVPDGHLPNGQAADEPFLDPALEARLLQKYGQQLSNQIQMDTIRIVNHDGVPITVYRA